MIWFERYGIPGAYFWAITILLLRSLYQGEVQLESLKNLIYLASITFLPIGYIATILQQCLYLAIPNLGILAKAMDNINKKHNRKFEFPGNPKDHKRIEVWTTLICLYKNKNCKKQELDDQKFIQEYGRRRNDVMTIDFSILLISIFSLFVMPFCTLVLKYKMEPNWLLLILFLIINLSVIVITIWNFFLLRIQNVLLAEKNIENYFGVNIFEKPKEKSKSS